MQEARAVQELSSMAADSQWLKEGLSHPFSPNHTSGMTTTEHVVRQLQMLEHVANDDYGKLAKMVKNPNESLRAGPVDLESLIARLHEKDWHLLALLVVFHDLGKVDPGWAQNHLDTTGVEWIAHDYDSAIFLTHNPDLLEPFEVDQSETAALIELCRLHSVPGQFFFGEGNVLAYQALLDQSPRYTTVARIHGIIDSMSALNERFIKPILSSHEQLAKLFERAESEGTTLEEVFRRQSTEMIKQEIGSACPLGPVSWRRLRLLLGNDVGPEQLLESVEKVPIELLSAFDRATDGDHTWYGTYVANAFGQGLIRVVDDPGATPLVVSNLVKVVACAAAKMQHRDQWALSALGPALRIQNGGAVAAREAMLALKDSSDLEAALSALEKSEILGMRVGGYGVEVKSKP